MKRFIALVAAVVAVAATEPCHAQSAGFAASEVNRLAGDSNPVSYSATRIRANVVNSAVPRYSYGSVTGGVNQNVFGGTPNKPFSSINRGPSVTPYLAYDQPFSNSSTSYYTLIKPQLEQQRMNQQLQKQQQLMQRQMGEITSRPPYDPQGSETMAPTGHTAVYMNFGGYYTPPAPRRK